MSDGRAKERSGSSAENSDGTTTGKITPRRIKAYLALMLSIPLIFLWSAIPIARSSTFPIVAEDPFLLNPDYAFSLKHVDCDVVIVGDSTAVTGLDPTVVEGATGLKTCNIAQSRSAVELLGTLALDTYLKNNHPPRFIVMQFAPETLARERSDFFWSEGLTLVLRKKSILQAFPLLALHPVQAYQFAVWAVKQKVRSMRRPPTDFSSTEVMFRERRGLLVLPKTAETHCVNSIAYGQPSTPWIQALREKYSRNGTRVLINVSPLPDCAPNTDALTKELEGATDNSIARYPVGLFCDLDRHLTLEGADRASHDLVRQLGVSMQRN
jgi:hypothetical protein